MFATYLALPVAAQIQLPLVVVVVPQWAPGLRLACPQLQVSAARCWQTVTSTVSAQLFVQSVIAPSFVPQIVLGNSVVQLTHELRSYCAQLVPPLPPPAPGPLGPQLLVDGVGSLRAA